MKILLQHKIFIGYFLLMVIIGSMVAIILHERNRVQKIEVESISIFQTQHNINTAHRYVTALVTYGESVLVWDNEDTLAYRKRRVQTDSMLQALRVQCEEFILPIQIDSLRTLLAAKRERTGRRQSADCRFSRGLCAARSILRAGTRRNTTRM